MTTTRRTTTVSTRMQLLAVLLLASLPRHRSCSARSRDDRGDVPGWVMITVMSAGVVALLTPIIGSQLQSMLQAALNSVK